MHCKGVFTFAETENNLTFKPNKTKVIKNFSKNVFLSPAFANYWA